MWKIIHLILFLAWLPASLLLADEEPSRITFKGFLGKDELAGPRKALQELKSGRLVIEINSSTGDLDEVFNITKQIYLLKAEKRLKLIVYIEDNALGPAAMLPFLADELYVSLPASWGDIAFGTENLLSANILRNRVISLIPQNHPQAALLTVIAEAMSDKNFNSKGSPIEKYAAAGDPLVLNQNQLTSLGLVKDVVNQANFEGLFFKASEKTSAEPAVEASPKESSFENQLAEHIKWNPQGPNLIGKITIEDHTTEINEATWLYVKNALDHYKKVKPIFIILELNTPGGEVFAAQKISDALKEMDTQYNIPVIAYINDWAISAGAMLAYSCRFIVAAKDASMGAAEPITIGTSGKGETASEKVNSALRADFANRASFFGRNPYIAEAMVDKDTVLVMRHGKIIKLDNENQIRSKGPDPDIIISPKGKLLTLNAAHLLQFHVAEAVLVPQKLEAVTDAEKEKGQWPGAKLALFQLPFFKSIPQAIVEPFQMDWKTRFFVFLASPMISSLLLLGLMVGFYMEVNTPGFGLAGTLAITCLFLIILSSFALEIANWLELIFLITGLAVVLVELFVLPTFGLLGLIGFILFIVGLFGMMLPGAGSVHYEIDTNTLNAAGEVFFERLAWLCGTLIVAFFIILVLARYVTPTLAGFSRLVLKGNEQQGYIAGENPVLLPKPGSQGEAISPLRPAGKILVEGNIYDALSTGGFIEKGRRIVVDRLDGSVIVVVEQGNHE